MVAQTLAQVGFGGGLAALGVVVGLVPAVLGVALPVALLLATVALGEGLVARGEALALAAAGYGARRLAALLVAFGLCAGAIALLGNHLVEPAGRAMVHRQLDGAAGQLQLRAGQPLWLGSLMVHAGSVEDGALGDVFAASGDLLVSAARGRLGPGAALSLEQGEVMRVALAGQPRAEWRLRFDAARLPLSGGARRVELVERSSPDLGALIDRMRAAGRDAVAERLALYKRSALPLCLPLLALLGLPLGARGARPAAAATVVALCWWALLRVCDQAVFVLGPWIAASIPPFALLIGTAAAWLSWRDR